MCVTLRAYSEIESAFVCACVCNALYNMLMKLKAVTKIFNNCLCLLCVCFLLQAALFAIDLLFEKTHERKPIFVRLGYFIHALTDHFC